MYEIIASPFTALATPPSLSHSNRGKWIAGVDPQLGKNKQENVNTESQYMGWVTMADQILRLVAQERGRVKEAEKHYPRYSRQKPEVYMGI